MNNPNQPLFDLFNGLAVKEQLKVLAIRRKLRDEHGLPKIGWGSMTLPQRELLHSLTLQAIREYKEQSQ